MAAFDFPSSPSVNQTYTANGVTWKWNGTMWMRVSGAGYLEKIEEGDSKVEVDDSGSGNITATVDGTEALRVDSSGRVLLGTTTPGHAIADNLTISDSGSCGITLISGTSDYGALYFGDSGGNNRGQVEYSHSADSLHFYTAAGERIRIKSDGKIGINNTSPGAMLQVDYDEGSSEVGLRLRAYNASGSKTWQLSEVNGNAGVFSIRNQTNSTEGLDIHGDGHVRVPTGDLRVGDNTDSNAGTQTISVGSVSSGSGGIGIFANPTNGNSFVQFGDGTSSADQYRGYMNYRHADDSLRFGTAGADRLHIDSSGNIGINNSSPDEKLHVGGNIRFGTNTTYYGVIEHEAGVTGSNIYTSKDTGGHIFKTGTTPTERMYLYANGKLHLGNSHIASNNLTRLHVGWNTGGTVAGESIIAGTLGNDTTAVSALLTMKNAGNRGAQGASGGSSLAKFEFNNGTAFEIDKYGRRTLPYQPGCKISIDTNGQNGGNHAQTGRTIVPFNSTAYGYNTGNHYNLTTHTWTCPLDGKYLVILSINVLGDNIAYIYKNGSIHSAGEFRSNPNGTWEHMEISAVVECSANDTIQPYSQMSNSGRKFNGGSGGSYWDTLSIYFLG